MKKDLKKLRQARAEKAQAGKIALDKLNTLLGKDGATDAEKAEITSLEAQVDVLEQDVTQLDADIAGEEKVQRQTTLFTSSSLSRPGTAARSIMVNDLDPARTGGFHSLGEFAQAVRTAAVGGGMDQRLVAAPTGFQQNQGAGGEGALVPPVYREQIWDMVFDQNDLLGFCNQEPTVGNSIGIIKDETTPWGSSGVQAAWRSEGTQMVASKAAITPTIVQLHELYAFVLATQEILDDAARLQNRITVQAAAAIRWKAFDAVMNGDGNGKPLGFMKAPSLVTVSKESGQATLTIQVANVLKMYSRVLMTGGGRPMWLANPDTLPQLGQLQIGNVPAWLPLNQPLQGTPNGGVFLGRPLMFNEHCASLTNVGDIVACDLSGYALATKVGGGVDFAASIHLFFDYNISAFRWVFRLGGQPYLSAAVNPANGSNTKSHFVALQAR